MLKENYSPGSARPSVIGFMQVVDNNSGCDSACEEPTAKSMLRGLIVRCDGTITQLQAFRDLLPEHIDSRPAELGLRCIAHTSLRDIEDDIQRLQIVRDNLAHLVESLPKRMEPQAEYGLKTLIDHYQFHLSRNWAFPN